MKLDDLDTHIAAAINEHGAAIVAMKLCESLTALSEIGGDIHHEDGRGQVKVSPSHSLKSGKPPSKDTVERLSSYHINVFKNYLGKYLETCKTIAGDQLTVTERDQLLVPLRNMAQEITKLLETIER